MKKKSISKVKWPFRSKSVFDYFKSHRTAAISSTLVFLCLIGAGGYSLWRQTAYPQASGISTSDSTTDNKSFDEMNKEQLDALSKLGVSKDAVDNSTPVMSKPGKCEGWYNDDGNGHFSVTTRQSDGSYKCVTFDLTELKDYKSADGSSSASSSIDPATGKRTTVLNSTDATGTTTTTTTVTNPDGSGQTSTDGGWWKVCYDKASTICINTNGTEMTTNFMTCKLQYENGDYRFATSSELAGRAVNVNGKTVPCSSVSLPNTIS